MVGSASFLSHGFVHHNFPQTQNLISHNYNPKLKVIKCALTKQGNRFLTSISSSTLSYSIDPSPTHRLIHKFVSTSSKSVSLTTLNHLISPRSAHSRLFFIVLPLYMKITQVSWFSWNSKLVASVIAFLYKQGQIEQAELLIAENISSFCSKERDLVAFYCNLIDSHAKLKSENGFCNTLAHLKEIASKSTSTYVRKRAYAAMVGGLCVMGRPHEARNLIAEMKQMGIRPSVFEFRSIVEGYGRIALFDEMLQSLSDMEKNGFALDMISLNMVLLSYGLHNELPRMVWWLQKAKGLGIRLSVRTYNSVLNSCPTVISLLRDIKTVPVSLHELIRVLEGGEGLLVQELAQSLLVDEIIAWDRFESKLDMHGMHLSTSYIIMLQWMEALRKRFTSGEYEVPAEITVVCGMGKRSSVRGESPVKTLVKEIVVRTRSPLRVDRKNIGCFVAKGRSVKEWLCINQ
ncbi:pentatricopeptide repeat-containing protein At2g17033 [Amaranthus tricolor]|uniref:pentatricopeptide repeat-containing protein At2g17033 n=1 Tax=Amaranthus tricolor TaxID=29722 RepID=UPI00258466D5|nr:pentatricopeptide repeat-containing protein At2g17033 [Amaranthus tricolor]